MSDQLLVALINFATKFGIEAGSALLKGIKGPSPSIDDAIAALEAASEKSLQQIIDETPTPRT